MDLQQIRYFLAVAKAGSFIKAAEAEGISQPAISQQIAKLESSLGGPLFVRMGRSLRLTPLGRDLVGEGEDLLRRAKSMRSIAEAHRDGERGRVMVGVIPTIMPYFIAPRIGSLRQQHPQMELVLLEAQTAPLLELLKAAEIDIAILALPVKNQEVVCSELFREELYVIGEKGRQLPAALDLRQLKEERLLLLREGNCLRDNVLTTCNRAHMNLERVFETDQLTSIFSLVAAGYGISLVPELAVPFHDGCAHAGLSPKAFRRIGYAQAKGNRGSPVQRTFLNWLRREADLLRKKD